jgi:hypothetical protein
MADYEDRRYWGPQSVRRDPRPVQRPCSSGLSQREMDRLRLGRIGQTGDLRGEFSAGRRQVAGFDRRRN